MAEPRLRIGNQTSRSRPQLMEPFVYAVENGFDAFEWFPDVAEGGAGWEERDLAPADRDWIRATAGRHDIRMSVHAPWRIRLCEPDGLDRALVSVGLALDIGASLVNLHMVNDRGIEPFAAALIGLLDLLEENTLQLSIENTPQTDPGDINGLFERLAEIRPSALLRVGMCLDLGHANLAAATRNDYLRFLDALGPHVPVIHIHLHENFGDADTHLPLFTGPAATDLRGLSGFVRRMRQRGFAGSIILEQWPSPPSLLNRAREGLLGMFASPVLAAEENLATKPLCGKGALGVR